MSNPTPTMTPRETTRTALQGTVLDEHETLTAAELIRACGVTVVQVETWVAEGVIEPRDPDVRNREEWRFAGPALARMRLAMRLERDLAVNAPGVALALDLLEEIASLRARLTASSRR